MLDFKRIFGIQIAHQNRSKICLGSHVGPSYPKVDSCANLGALIWSRFGNQRRNDKSCFSYATFIICSGLLWFLTFTANRKSNDLMRSGTGLRKHNQKYTTLETSPLQTRTGSSWFIMFQKTEFIGSMLAPYFNCFFDLAVY